MAEIQPQNRFLGYARVSTYGQMLAAQRDQFKAARCSKIYREKASGAQADRKKPQRMLKALAHGDVVMVTRIDRLARSTFDLFAIVKRIVDACGQFKSLADLWADTATSTGRLMIALCGGLANGTLPSDPDLAWESRQEILRTTNDGAAGNAGCPRHCRGATITSRGLPPRRTAAGLALIQLMFDGRMSRGWRFPRSSQSVANAPPRRNGPSAGRSARIGYS